MIIYFLVPHTKIAGGVRTNFTYAHWLTVFGHQVQMVVETKSWWQRFLTNFLGFKPAWVKNLYQVKIKRVKRFTSKNLASADVVVADSWAMARKLYHLDLKAKKVHFIQHDERLYHGNPEEVTEVYKYPMTKIVISNWLKEIIEKEFNQSAHLVLTSFDREVFHPVPGVRESEAVRVLLLDHSYAWKGTAEGVEIILDLKEKYPQVKLIGFGARRANPQLPYDEYHFNLPQTKLAGLYSGCDIYCCPSWHEGFGMPSLEAMACHSALATYDNGGSRDFAFDGETALVAEARNRDALKNKLEQLIENKELREKIAEGGYQLSQKWPTWEMGARQFEKIFKEL